MTQPSHQRAPSKRNIFRKSLLVLASGLSLILSAFAQPARASLTLAELRAEQDLTPERFIKHFADFKFELGGDLRAPESFLARQSGDCDDFATLAADILREKGYCTRLVVVYMPKDIHVVCYVAEAHSYLDYNCRKLASPLVPCEGELEAIAAKVSESFRTQWRSVSEVAFQNGAKHFLNTVFR